MKFLPVVVALSGCVSLGHWEPVTAEAAYGRQQSGGMKGCIGALVDGDLLGRNVCAEQWPDGVDAFEDERAPAVSRSGSALPYARK